MDQPVQCSIQHGIGIIRLNRPDKYNAFNRAMSLAIQHALDEFAHDQQVRAVLITGNGKAFSAGQDLEEVMAADGPGISKILSEHFNPIIMRIRHLEKPVVAAVNGVAAGAGANIALCCDIVIASEKASFIQAFSKIGLIPDSGGTFFLPRLIGFQKASAVMMLGDQLSAEDAEKWGMIYKVFPADDFEAAAIQLAGQLAKMPTRALGFTKKALNDSWSNDLTQQLALEDVLQQQSAKTDDYQEGVKAFLEKRKPVFSGS